MAREDIILQSIRDSELDDSGTSGEVKYIFNKTQGLQLALNYEFVLNEQFLSKKGNRDILVYLDEKLGVYRFGYLEDTVSGGEMVEKIKPYDIFEKVVDAIESIYGRVLSVKLEFHFESGFMMFVPQIDQLGKKEVKTMFRKSIIFTKSLINQLMIDSEEQGPSNLTHAKELYGQAFEREIGHFNIPLWVDQKENDKFFEEKSEIFQELNHELSNPNLPYKRFPEIENFSTLQYEVSYKPARVRQNKNSRRSLLMWVFIPYSSLERIGIERIEDLVDRFVKDN